MGSKQAPDHAPVPAQETQAPKDDPHPPRNLWLERFLMRIGFFEHKYNAMIMICVTLCPYLFEYLVCRRYCGIEDCFFYRKTASRCTDILLILYYVRIRYLAWFRDRQQAIGNASATSS